MTFTYCDARHDGTPVHRCLCTNQVMHNGAHKCVCGHTWGLDWNQLTYDQQREHLGLPPKPFPTYMEVAQAISAACAYLGDLVGVQLDTGEWDFSEMGREAIQHFLTDIEERP